MTYFNTCLQVPETFNISNNSVNQLDNDNPFGGAGNDMFLAMLGGQGGMGF